MELESDENIPPPKDEKPNQTGYMSPFGFLAGVRAMLSPTVKDQPPSEGPETPVSRSVLRDVNMARSPKSKNDLSVAQVPAQTPGTHGTPGGDAQLLSVDKGSWSERGERTSIASEISFVSALSSDNNTSLPDILQTSSTCRSSGVESDTDTSTAYESAGETEGNLSSRDAHFASIFNDPNAVSSPYETDHLESGEVDSVFKVSNPEGSSGSQSIIVLNGLNETIQLEDSSENGTGNVSVSYLVDHLGSLSLSTPFKTKNDSTVAKAHITLDSDVSGDIISSPGPFNDSVLNSEAQVQETLDSTFTRDSDFNEEELAEAPEQNKVPSKSENLNKTVDVSFDSCVQAVQDYEEGVNVQAESENLNKTVDVSLESCVRAGQNYEEEVNGTVFSEVSATEWKLLEELGQTFNSSSFNQYDTSVTEAKLLEGLSVNVSLSESQSSSHTQGGDDDSAALNETVVEVTKLPGSPNPEVAAANETSGDFDKFAEDGQEQPCNTETELELETRSVVCEAVDPSESNPEEIIECSPAVSVGKPAEQPVKEETVGDSKLDTFASPILLEPVEHLILKPEPVVDTTSLKTHQATDEISNELASETHSHTLAEEETAPITVPVDSDDAPLPVKVPRSFEEILEAELAAEGQLTYVPEPEVKLLPSYCSLDEAPLPVKTPRTFEEILEEQLAAEGHLPALPESTVSQNSESTSSDDIPLPVKVQRTFEEILAEEFEGQTPAVVKPPACEEAKASEISDSCEEAKASEISDSCEEIPVLEASAPSTNEVIELSETATIVPEEVPIPIRAPRTFEEILAAELAAQSDPEQAVPSFSIPKAGAASPGKLNESYAKIISSDTTPLDLESEPVLTADTIHHDLESEGNNGLDSLIERCKLQEQDLEQGESSFRSVAAEASKLSLSCLNESLKSSSIRSEDSVSSDSINQTVIMVDSCKSNSFADKYNEEGSPQTAALQVSCEKKTAHFEQFGKPINFEEEDFKSGDAFKDPSAFDFLSLHGGTRSARDLRKESLYVKFDPLIGSLISDSSSSMHPENSSNSQSGATAVGQQGTQEDSSEQINSNDASEKLISLSPSASKKQTEDSCSNAPTCTTPAKPSAVKSTPVKTPVHIMLNETLESIGSRGTLVKQEDLIKKLQEHQSVLEEQDKAYQERISELEQRIHEMEIHKAEQLHEKEKQIQEKDKQLREKVQSLGELNVIMKEYEKTISRLVSEKSQEKKVLEEKHGDLVKEKDQAQQHLNNMEIAFADLHVKYERLKSVVESFKKNEETLNAALSEKQANIDKMQNMYDMLKSHAVAKLEKANQDLETFTQKHQQENAKLKAIIKKLEVKSKSLEETLEQKTKENQALTAICDELINKVGD